MSVQRRPIGDAAPIGSISRSSPGGGNCDWITLTAPYEIIAVPRAKRR